MKQSIMLEKNLQEEQITYEGCPEPSFRLHESIVNLMGYTRL
jgi:hypothetical protein